MFAHVCADRMVRKSFVFHPFNNGTGRSFHITIYTKATAIEIEKYLRIYPDVLDYRE